MTKKENETIPHLNKSSPRIRSLWNLYSVLAGNKKKTNTSNLQPMQRQILYKQSVHKKISCDSKSVCTVCTHIIGLFRKALPWESSLTQSNTRKIGMLSKTESICSSCNSMRSSSSSSYHYKLIWHGSLETSVTVTVKSHWMTCTSFITQQN